MKKLMVECLPPPLKESCQVCERPRWGNIQYLGFGKWRHEECYPGSPAWREYYTTLPKAQQTPEGDTLYQVALEKGKGNKGG